MEGRRSIPNAITYGMLPPGLGLAASPARSSPLIRCDGGLSVRQARTPPSLDPLHVVCYRLGGLALSAGIRLRWLVRQLLRMHDHPPAFRRGDPSVAVCARGAALRPWSARAAPPRGARRVAGAPRLRVPDVQPMCAGLTSRSRSRAPDPTPRGGDSRPYDPPPSHGPPPNPTPDTRQSPQRSLGWHW